MRAPASTLLLDFVYVPDCVLIRSRPRPPPPPPDDIISGWWLFTSKREHINFSNVQTVRMGSDEKSYGTRLPGYKHVVIEPLAIPFVGDPPGIKVAEMFGLPVPVVEALRDELAARAGKPAVPTRP